MQNDFSKGGFGYEIYNCKCSAKVTHLNNEQMDNVLSAVYLNYEPQDPMYVGMSIKDVT